MKTMNDFAVYANSCVYVWGRRSLSRTRGPVSVTFDDSKLSKRDDILSGIIGVLCSGDNEHILIKLLGA